MSELIERYQKIVKVLGMHAEGKTIRKALREVNEGASVGLSRQLFERMCVEDAELRALRFEAARCFQESYHDLLLNIDDDPVDGRTDAKMAAVISSNIKHVLAVDNPDKFGSRMKVEHNITASDAIVSALEAARRRAGLGPVIDAVVVGVVVGPEEERMETLPAPTSCAATTTPAALDDPFAALAASLT